MLQHIADFVRPGHGSTQPVIADKGLFVPSTARYRRAKAWFEAQVAKAQKEGYLAVVGTLTPELADFLLTRNESNRGFSEITVQRYAEDMREGRWIMNGETLIISVEGQLNDGQHRCHACIRSGREVETCFFFGAKRDSRTSIDQGMAKTPGHYLEMLGYKNGRVLAHAARLIYLYEKIGRITRAPEVQPTKGHIVDFVCDHPELLLSDKLVARRYRGTAASGMLVACHFIFARLDRPAADKFILNLINGVGLDADDPVYVLRERLVGDRAARKGDPNDVPELIIRAWNMRRSRRRTTKVQLGADFPKAI